MTSSFSVVYLSSVLPFALHSLRFFEIPLVFAIVYLQFPFNALPFLVLSLSMHHITSRVLSLRVLYRSQTDPRRASEIVSSVFGEVDSLIPGMSTNSTEAPLQRSSSKSQLTSASASPCVEAFVRLRQKALEPRLSLGVLQLLKQPKGVHSFCSCRLVSACVGLCRLVSTCVGLCRLVSTLLQLPWIPQLPWFHSLAPCFSCLLSVCVSLSSVIHLLC